MGVYESVLLDRDERVLAVLGKANGVSVLCGEGSKEGVAVLSNKRIYFRGMCRKRDMGGFSNVKTDAAVPLNQVQDFRKAYRTNAWAKTLFGIFMTLGFICTGLGVLLMAMDIEEFGLWMPEYAFGILLLFASSFFRAFDLAGNYSMYLIENHERDYGINLSSVTEDEIVEFEKILSEITGKASSVVAKKEKKQEAPVSAPVPQVVASSVDIPAELKKYKELLDSGIITQEEFDAQKKKLLNL